MYKKVVALCMVMLAGLAPLRAVTMEQLLKTVGESGYDYFGCSVANAGDVNGDGYDDVIVGAYKYDDGSNTNVGAAYIFFGGPSTDANYDVKLAGENENDYFGYSVSTAGDVNGDGYDDVIVGAIQYDDGSNEDVGAAYIFFGGPSMDATFDVKLVGENAYDYFGRSVSTAGDVNGDGYDDVIVGAYGYDDGSNTNVGAAYIFFGGPSTDANYDVKLTGENENDYFGRSVSMAGDVNGDGYDDVIVGASYSTNGSNYSAGAAYIFFGGPSMDATFDVKLVGENAHDYFGRSVSTAGDVNGDGYDDVIVGADHYDDGLNTDAGATYIFFGGPSMDANYDVKMAGENVNDWFGASVSTAGDVNGDGYDDVIVGAIQYEDGSNEDAGATYIFFGGPSMDANYDVKLVGENIYDYFGYSVSTAGDVNGDGYDDVIVGANQYDDGSNPNAGATYLYDFYLYKLVSPYGGETWHVGAPATVAWKGEQNADIYLSPDGGTSWNLIAGNVPGAGSGIHRYSFTVPHLPSRYSMIRVVYPGASLSNRKMYAQSDSFFTIQATVTLLAFNAEPGEDGKVHLTWRTDPGPDVLAGYNLYRIDANGNEVKVNSELIRTGEFTDEPDGFITGYALGAVNGLGEEYRVGEVSLLLSKKAIVVFPSVVRSRARVAFFVPDLSPVSSKEDVELRVVDVSGRCVEVKRGSYRPGVHILSLDAERYSSGVYFAVLRVGGEYRRVARFQVLR